MNSKRLALVSLNMLGQPIGLVHLASWVEDRLPDWSVRVIDTNWEDPETILSRERFDVIGISSMTTAFERARRLARTLKRRGIQAPIIIGGVHVSTCSEHHHPEFDAVISGEGEAKLGYYLEHGTVPPDEKIDLSQYPDLNFGHYHEATWRPKILRHWQASVVEATLLTSRGCPFRCRFCATTQFWHRYRAHTPDWVVRQLQALAEKGADRIAVWDDLFTVNKGRLRAIAERFENAQLQKVIKGMSVQGRADVIDEETCDYLRRMNVEWVGFGLESGSNRVLKYLKNQHASVAQNGRAMSICRRAGIKTGGSIMMGNPTETVREMMQTIWWTATAWRHGAYDINAFVATPYPGTEFWDIALAHGRVSDTMSFDELTLNRSFGTRARMLSIARWKFLFLLALLEIALLPYKVAKAWRLTAAFLKQRLARSRKGDGVGLGRSRARGGELEVGPVANQTSSRR